MRINLIAFEEVEHTGFKNGENIEIERIYSMLAGQGVEISRIYLNEKNIVEESKNCFAINIMNVHNTTIDRTFDMIKLVKKCREESYFILFGRFATSTASFILEECPEIDGVILGHPERVCFDLLHQIKNNQNVADAIYKNDHIVNKYGLNGKVASEIDINQILWPDRDTLIKNHATIAYIRSSHGCVGKCSFCGMFYNEPWSGRSAQDIFHEIISIYSRTGIRIYIFEDASFEDKGLEGKNKINELCERLIDYPIKFAFRCFMRTESFKETEGDLLLLNKMREAGFVNILWGVEAGNDDDLRIYRKRATLKDNQQIRKLLMLTGHDFLYGFIMMNPYSTVKTLKANINYLHEIGCSHLEYYVSAVRLLYGTPLYEMVKRDHLLIDEKDYKNHYNYHYQDGRIEEISVFLSKEFDFHCAIMKNDYEEFHFEQFLRYLKHIYGAEVEKLWEELRKYQIQLSELMFQFFASIYCALDVGYGTYHIVEFKTALNRVYDKIKHLKLRVIKFYAKKQYSEGKQRSKYE